MEVLTRPFPFPGGYTTTKVVTLPGVHEGVFCDICNATPLPGMRFQMKYVPGSGFDVCELCMFRRAPNNAYLERYKVIMPTDPTPRGDRVGPSGAKKTMLSSLAGRAGRPRSSWRAEGWPSPL